MANFLLNNLFRIAVSTLNFVSPSIVADILLHPFDFATVLLQIGFDPEGLKCQNTTVFSVILQYALFTFYIPYLLTTMESSQVMGMPHPSIFYYVGYIYRKEGIMGCYRGLIPKVCERMVMTGINEKIKKRINKGSFGSPDVIEMEVNNDAFITTLVNTICSQFFAVLISHPIHVLMVSSFAEFTCGRKSSLFELFRSIYSDDGCFGFFTGLTARLLGEILSLMFSVTYTSIINTQLTPERPVLETCSRANGATATNFVNYVTDASRYRFVSGFWRTGNGHSVLIFSITRFNLKKAVHYRFTVFKPRENRLGYERVNREEEEDTRGTRTSRRRQFHAILDKFLRSLTQNSLRTDRIILSGRRLRLSPVLDYIPLTSKIFYYIMLRDFLSKKISTPFFLVCHCSIVLDTGWDKFPFSGLAVPMANLFQKHFVPEKKGRINSRCRSKYKRT